VGLGVDPSEVGIVEIVAFVKRRTRALRMRWKCGRHRQWARGSKSRQRLCQCPRPLAEQAGGNSINTPDRRASGGRRRSALVREECAGRNPGAGSAISSRRWAAVGLPSELNRTIHRTGAWTLLPLPACRGDRSGSDQRWVGSGRLRGAPNLDFGSTASEGGTFHVHGGS
jgi:hypothetical protein